MIDAVTSRPLTDPVVQAIRAARDAGESERALAQRLGISRTKLRGLLQADPTVTITLATADRVAEVLGLRVVGRDGPG